MIYLIALNREQADYHARDMGIFRNEYRVITNPMLLQGLGPEGNTFLKVGEWIHIHPEHLDEIEHRLEFIRSMAKPTQKREYYFPVPEPIKTVEDSTEAFWIVE